MSQTSNSSHGTALVEIASHACATSATSHRSGATRPATSTLDGTPLSSCYADAFTGGAAPPPSLVTTDAHGRRRSS